MALRDAVEALGALVIGENPLQVEAIAAKLRQAASGAGPGGLFTLALSAIDIALWDIKGKALGQSVHALLGGYRDRAPTYASGALMRQHPTAYLAEAGPRLVEMGFKQMKTQMGAEPTVAREVERMRVLREGIGEDIDLDVRYQPALDRQPGDRHWPQSRAIPSVLARGRGGTR